MPGPDRTGPIRLEDGTVTHFTWEECACRHCGRLPDSEQAVINAARMMERVREILGDQPIRVHSWYRCPVHNRAIGGATLSQHQFGRAVDFSVKHLTPRQVQAKLRRHHGTVFRGFGRYAGFTHVDNRPEAVASWDG